MTGTRQPTVQEAVKWLNDMAAYPAYQAQCLRHWAARYGEAFAETVKAKQASK